MTDLTVRGAMAPTDRAGWTYAFATAATVCCGSFRPGSGAHRHHGKSMT
ncbi:hypothetical protein ACVII1_009216 [Bradyrhizobium elkanii]